MPFSEHLQRLFKLIEKTHSDAQHRQLLIIFIAWMFLFAIFYGFKYGEQNFYGDLVHQITTALNHVDPTIFSKDYVYADPKTTAYYSPLQIGSIGALYRLTGSMSGTLAILQFLYSALCVLGAWLIAKQMTRNVWIMLVFILTILQFTIIPLNGGWTWGILRGPMPVFFPNNQVLARSLILVFIALLLSKKQPLLTAQAATLGVLFTVHAPTGLTLSMGAVPYFIQKLIASTDRFKDLITWIVIYLIGASFFLINYWINIPNSVPLTPAENAFLYDFLKYRAGDHDYPQTIWKLFTLRGLKWSWVSHTALIMVTLTALWGIIAKNGAILLASTGLLLGYIYNLKAIPLALFIIWVSYWGRENIKSLPSSTWSLALITYGAFIVITWAQWAYDIYHAEMQTPPLLVDNIRFISYLFPFTFVLFAAITKKIKKWGLLIAAYGILTLPLIFYIFDPTYQNYASAHNVKVANQYDFSSRFSMNKSDHEKVLKFAASSPKGSLFLYLSNGEDAWYFRLRARRSLAINSSDLVFKYYSKKKELVNDWLIYTSILESYKDRDIESLCELTKDMAIDFIVFPKVKNMDSFCFDIALDMESGAVYSRKRLSR